MSLRRCPLVYLFVETSRLAWHREFFEVVIGLPLIEVEPHLPHHRHGVTKYDAGGTILSLNMSGPSRFPPESSDALVTVFDAPAGRPAASRPGRVYAMPDHGTECLTDADGHHYVFRNSDCRERAVITEFRLSVPNLRLGVAFYRDVLDLRLVESDRRMARFDAGRTSLVLVHDETTVDGRRPRYDTYQLVFLTADIQDARARLIDRGLAFRGARVGFSEIGGTLRFDDPFGQRYCLYAPSQESLTWGSGPKVREIAASADADACAPTAGDPATLRIRFAPQRSHARGSQG